ncbi:MAG: hypothetical protein DMG21_04470 [Acidobacteria bacterium]|nr:MAG: hypothetical protein DMG21_04470 [Acidobacteriota bacterium]
MAKRMNLAKPDCGVALLVVLIAILVLTALAAGIVLVTQTQVLASYNYRVATQSRYAAEAGVQRTMNWILNSYTPPSTFTSYDMTQYPVKSSGSSVVLSATSGVSSNYPDSTQQSAFNTALSSQSVPGISGAAFSTYATLLRMTGCPMISWLSGSAGGVPQTWQITSVGSVAGNESAQVQVVATYDRQTTAMFTYAVAATGSGCGSINLQGGAYTDSFDSDSGSYSSSVQTSGGNVATNGNMYLAGTNTQVEGTFYGLNSSVGTSCSYGINNNSHATPAYQGTSLLSAPINYPTPAAPSPAPPTTAQSISGSCGAFSGCTNNAAKDVSLSPSYQYGNLNVSSGTTVHLATGTYNINSLTLGGNSVLSLTTYPSGTATGPVILNFAGAGGVSPVFDLSGGSISNITADAGDVQIVYGGTGTITIAGGANSYGIVYAPNAPVTTSGSASWLGAVVSNTFTDSGGAAVHYDAALNKCMLKVGPFLPVNFSWSKF